MDIPTVLTPEVVSCRSFHTHAGCATRKFLAILPCSEARILLSYLRQEFRSLNGRDESKRD